MSPLPESEHLMIRRHVIAVVLLCLLLAGPVMAAPALWRVQRGDSAWRTPPLERALAASGSLTIELTDDDDVTMQALVLQYGLDPAHPLSALLTPAENTTLTEAAQTAGVPGGTRTLQMMRPWLAAITLTVAPLVKAGLDPAHGVDKQLKAQMRAAGKPVLGLETAAGQIRFLADLPAPVQLAMLRATLRDMARSGDELRTLIDAWEAGDTATLARIEDTDLRQQQPQLYQRLLVQRNEAWAAKINAMLQHPGTRFIAVGAAHLAGADSVQAQLRKVGIEAVRQ